MDFTAFPPPDGIAVPDQERPCRLVTKILLVMKLTMILLTAAFLNVSASGISQTVTLSGSNMPLEKVFNQIEKQTGYVFFYDEAFIRKARPVSFEAKDVKLDNFLKAIFKGQPLLFRITGNNVIIKPAAIAAQQLPNPGLFEELSPLTVTGTVLGNNNQPLSGATVQVKGKNTTAISDDQGSFRIIADVGNTLLISYVGFERTQVKVNDSRPLRIVLQQIDNTMDTASVVVNTGYQKLKPNEITGSVEVITNEELNRRPGSDILSRLEGVTTSILFDRRSLSPGKSGIDASKIMVRGLSTITESIKAPLIIVNDFPYEGDINNINPNDVETITILKDASAASIWGARAGNGVIVITTKQGRYNQSTNLTVQSNVGITEKPDLFHFPQMPISDVIDLEVFLFNKNFYNGDLNNVRYPALTPVVEVLNDHRNGKISDAELATQIATFKTQDVRKDFEKYVYQTSILQQYSLGISGGSQKIKYALSGGFDRNTLALRGDEFNRLTFRSNTTIIPIKNLEATLAVAYSATNAQNNSLGDATGPGYSLRQNQRIYPYARLADAQGNHLNVARDYRGGYVDTAGGGLLQDWTYRPLDELELADNTSILKDLVLAFSANYKFTPHLNAQVSYQYQDQGNLAPKYYSKETWFARDLINLYSQIQNGTIKYIVPNEGIQSNNSSTTRSTNARAQLNLNRAWLKHQVIAMAGAEVRERIVDISSYRIYGYNKESLSVVPVDFQDLYPRYGGRGNGRLPSELTTRKLTDHFVSFFGNFAYTFDKKYSLSISGRRDASNLFGVDINNKWKPLWSIGGAWTISNENFYRSKTISLLRLRATLGYQGNINNSLTPSALLLRFSFPNMVNEPFANLDKPADPNLSWETIRQINLGVDVGSSNNRISGSIEYYHKQSDNLVFNALADPTTGLPGVKKNSADILGQGLEISLNTVNIQGRFKWTTGLGFAWQTFKVTNYLLDDATRTIGAGQGLNILPVKKRNPYGVFSYPFAGLDPANGDPMGYIGKEVSKDYPKIMMQAIDTSNIVYHGPGVPPFFGYINNTFSFGGLSLTVNISWRFGHYFRKNTISYGNLFSSGAGHRDFVKRWQQPGDEQHTNVPSMIYPPPSTYRDDFYAGASVNILKADNIRFQYLRLAYDFKKFSIGNFRVSNIQLFAFANNLGIIWRANHENLDPEYDQGNALYPPVRTINIGAKVDL